MAKKQNKTVKQNTRNQLSKNNKLAVITAVVLLAALVVYLVFSFINQRGDSAEEYMFVKEGELSIADSSGNAKTKLDIEIAESDFDRQLGLMFRKSMEENQGMLFIFPEDEILSFWMRNTFIPLDIIFLDSAKQIVSISKNTLPLTDNSYASSKLARYVLEVNAGFTDKYNITEGDKINYNQN